MEKINEFVNTEKEFETLDRCLYLETGHLSNLDDIMNTKSFSNILDKGDRILSFIINKIVIEESVIFNSYFLLFKKITGITNLLKDGDEKTTKLIRKRLSEWWEVNKDKYGK